MNQDALKDLLYRLADDALILGHRNSEWTGIGPVLEEDIAFASMAQDKMGHALNFYNLLHELGEADPDTIAFMRDVRRYRCCHLVEMPIGDYAFSLMRHFLYDFAADIRFQSLREAAWSPLSALAQRISREQKYHLMHARTFVQQLGSGTEESRLRMQSALNETLPMAYGIFESTEATPVLAEEGIQRTEEDLQAQWLETITPILQDAGLVFPEVVDPLPFLGGRRGYHTEHLEPLVEEMTEVFRLDPAAQW